MSRYEREVLEEIAMEEMRGSIRTNLGDIYDERYQDFRDGVDDFYDPVRVCGIFM